MQLATGVSASMPDPAAQVLAGSRVTGAGSSLALERVFDEHHVLVYRTAYRVTGNAADAEDVLQTVFLRLAGRETSAELIENPESYLRRAAVNAAINLLELKSRRNVPLDSAPEPHATANQPDRGDLRDVLRRAIATLGGRTAEMFALRFIEGHSNSEIGEMFGVSPVVVAVTVHRARKQLQKEIQRLGGLQ
jgi:RNA polymerase sigma-70 factor (ECF subfamily)